MTPCGALVVESTESFMRCKPIDNIAIIGPCKSVNSVHQYILYCQAVLAAAPIPDKDLRKITIFSQNFDCFIESKIDLLLYDENILIPKELKPIGSSPKFANA